jgi:hypothetical protein
LLGASGNEQCRNDYQSKKKERCGFHSKITSKGTVKFLLEYNNTFHDLQFLEREREKKRHSPHTENGKKN